MRAIALALITLSAAACTEVIHENQTDDANTPEAVVVEELEPDLEAEVDRDCLAIDDEFMRQECIDEGLTEQELVLRDMRPTGVPADRINVADILEGMRSHRAQNRVYPIPEEAQTDDPVLLLSRITVSEEGWGNVTGMRALYQVARSIRARTCNPEVHTQCEDGEETILSALRRLSSRVSGMRPPTRWRQYWTSTLPRGAAEEPARLWRECEPGSAGRDCDGTWDNYRPLWVETQEAAERLLGRSRPLRACQGSAMAWGCSDCGDDVFMARRNARREGAGLPPYVELECEEGVNNRIWGIRPEEEPAGLPSILASVL